MVYSKIKKYTGTVADFNDCNIFNYQDVENNFNHSIVINLKLANNHLTSCPELDCPELVRLDLQKNKIKVLDFSLLQLPALEEIYLANNLILDDLNSFSDSESSDSFKNYSILSILRNRNVHIGLDEETEKKLKEYDTFFSNPSFDDFNVSLNYYLNFFNQHKLRSFLNLSYFKINNSQFCSTSINEIAKRQIKHLDLSYNHLSELKDDFKNLTYLQTLSLVHNDFQLIPEILLQMHSLKQINLSHNPVNNIDPENIKRWSYLKSKGVNVILSEKLKFTNTKLDKTLSQIGLDSKEIDLSNGNFSAIPESLSFFLENFKNLTRINLSRNDFATLPLITLNEDIKQQIVKIDLSNNEISILPSSSDIKKYYPNLVILDLSNNALLEKNVENIFIIQELKHKVNVMINSPFIQKRLDFLEKCLKQSQQNTLNGDSLFKELSDVSDAEIFQMLSLFQEKRRPNVEVIILKNNYLDSLSTLKIEQIKTLRELDLSHNAFSSIPSINNTTSLQTINLTANPLDKTDPNNISQWLNLTHQGIDVKIDYDPSTCIKLDLSEVSIGTLPETVFKFYTHYNRFDVLDLSNTKISLLPDFFREFNALRILRLDHNQFTHIPAVLLELSYLEELTLSANPINFQDPENRRIFNELVDKNVTLDIIFPNPAPSNIPVTHSPAPVVLQQVVDKPVDIIVTNEEKSQALAKNTLRKKTNTTKIVLTDPQLINALEAFSEANYGKLILQL